MQSIWKLETVCTDSQFGLVVQEKQIKIEMLPYLKGLVRIKWNNICKVPNTVLTSVIASKFSKTKQNKKKR